MGPTFRPIHLQMVKNARKLLQPHNPAFRGSACGAGGAHHIPPTGSPCYGWAQSVGGVSSPAYRTRGKRNLKIRPMI